MIFNAETLREEADRTYEIYKALRFLADNTIEIERIMNLVQDNQDYFNALAGDDKFALARIRLEEEIAEYNAIAEAVRRQHGR